MEWKNKMWKTCVYVITFSMLAALLLCLNMTWSAALALIVLHFMDAALATHNCPYLFCAALLPLVVARTGCRLGGGVAAAMTRTA